MEEPQLDRILNTLFFNTFGTTWITSDSDLMEVSDLFYLLMVPWFNVHNRDIESYHREGSQIIIGLEGNSRILMDLENKTYSVIVEGVEIARNESTFCQLDGERIAFYSHSAGNLSAPLPKGWNASKIGAFALSTSKAEKFEVSVARGQIAVFVPGSRPVMVYRDGAKARQRLAVMRLA